MTDNSKAPIVTPHRGRGRPVSLHPAGPLWSLTCGHCLCTWQARIPRVSYPVLPCQHCGGRNAIPLVWGNQ